QRPPGRRQGTRPVLGEPDRVCRRVAPDGQGAVEKRGGEGGEQTIFECLQARPSPAGIAAPGTAEADSQAKPARTEGLVPGGDGDWHGSCPAPGLAGRVRNSAARTR